MKEYKYVLLDLDGTLSDPKEGLTKGVAYALKQFGIDADPDSLTAFIGPPFRETMPRYYGFSPEETERAIRYYREYYAKQGMFENVIYPDTKALLAAITAAGRKAIMATSKAITAALPIVSYFGLDDDLYFVAGALPDGSRERKGDVIEYALKECGIEDRENAVMVGDREHDIIGAKQAGIDSVGVLYGYGTREELEAAGADYIAADMRELARIVAGREL